MSADPRVQQLLDQLFDSGVAPEEVCRSCPELLPEVRVRWRRMGRVRAELGALFAPALEIGASPLLGGEGLPVVPGYDVEDVLGQGGFGVVFRAWDLRLGRPVALKMLLAGAFASPTELARFQREAEAFASVRHPNIVQIFEVGDHEGRPYFTMELVDGGSLAQKLTGTPAPARWAAGLVAALADAAAVAHSTGIVHRDLKPANILLAADGTPKISDFGLARRVEGGDGLTWTGTAVGTPGYMAPEQASGTAGPVGPAADVYGLGAVLYELLTGRPPFRGGTALETFRQVLSDEPVPPSRLNPRVPRDLETVCLKCLQKEPQRRYSGAAALAEDLRRYLLGRVVLARPVGNWERAGKWVRRNPAVAGLSAAAVFALVAGTVASLLFAFEAGRQAGIATDRARKLEDQAAELERQALELKAQTRAAEESARRAQDNKEEATRILVSSWLNAIGRNQVQLAGPLGAVEWEVLHPLRAAPAHIRLQFLEAALRDPDVARRVGRRADWVTHAIVGCDRALRAGAEQRIVRRIQEPGAPQDVLLACARLGQSVNIKDRAWAERAAAAVIAALNDPETERGDYPYLAETLVVVSEHLPPTRAAGYAAQVINGLLTSSQDPSKVFHTSYKYIGQTIVVISPLLDEDTAARAAAALGAGIRQPPTYSFVWQPLAKALVAVCRRLPPPDATAHVHRTVDWMVESYNATSEKDKASCSLRAAALLPFCGRLDADRAARVTDMVLDVLGDGEKIGPRSTDAVTACAGVLTAVAEHLDAPGNLRAAEGLIRVLRKPVIKVYPFEQLKAALVTNCRRLDAAGAARVAEAVAAAVRDPKTAAGVRAVLASVPAAVGDQLDPVRAGALECALVDSLLTDLAGAKAPYSGGVEWRMVAAVAEACGRGGAPRAADALTEMICNPQTPIAVLEPLVEALVVVGGQLPPGDATSHVDRVIAVLAPLWRTRAKSLDRIVLVEALAAAWAGAGPTKARAHARGMVADLEALLRDPKLAPFEQHRLARVLAVAYGHLGPDERAARSNALFTSHADTILAALRDPRSNFNLMTISQFAESIVALCMLLDRPEAGRVFGALLVVLGDPATQRYRLGYWLHFQEESIRKLFTRLDEADLRRLLEHPLAVGGLQRIILDVLGESKRCTFRNTWDYLDRAAHENATGAPAAKRND